MAITETAAHRRIASLLDEQSFVEIGSRVVSRLADSDPSLEKQGDGVVCGYGTIGGALVYVYAQDASAFGGAIGEMHARKICRLYNMAVTMGAPIIALVDCSGVRLQEGNDSLYSFGRMFREQTRASGVVPQIMGVFGSCGGGMAVSASMADFVFMKKGTGKLFLNSPNAVLGNYEEKCDTSSAAYQAAETGLADFAGTEEEILGRMRELVSMLPQNNESDLSYDVCEDDLNRALTGIENCGSKAEMLQMISDNGTFLEIKKDHAPEMTVGLIRLNGQTIGAVANNDPLMTHLGCKKAIHFISFCDAFNIPVLTLADTDGFARDAVNEQQLARALGKLTFTYANASVPTVTVVTGHAYGTAGLVMNSKALGANMVYAWEQADMGLMDPKPAAQIVYAEEIEQAEDKVQKTEELTAQYRRTQSSAEANARRGYVDDIIQPAETRQRVIAAFEMLYTKSTLELNKKHGTV